MTLIVDREIFKHVKHIHYEDQRKYRNGQWLFITFYKSRFVNNQCAVEINGKSTIEIID